MRYHVGQAGLLPGTVIPRGSWGNTVRLFRDGGEQIGNNGAVLMWEVALEAARQLTAREAPSRLDCIFACGSHEAAQRFRDAHRSGSHIYKIELVDADSPIWRGDFALLTTGSEPFIDVMIANATRYWSSSHQPKEPEYLIGGDVRVDSVA